MNKFVTKYTFFAWIVLSLLYSCKDKSKDTIAENEFYTCSMDPQIMEKQPGNCPICKMKLTKIVIDKSQAGLVKLSDEQIKLGNIKTDTVRPGNMWNGKTLTGVFTINRNTQEQISSRFNGRIEKLYFKVPGEEIKKGDIIYEVYSRELMQAEEEYLLALDNTNSNMPIEPAKNRLLLWGLNEDQIKSLEQQKEAKIINPIYSQVAGTTTEILFKEGDYIVEGSTIFKLADLTTVWVEAQVYTNELDFINNTTKLQVIPQAYPEEIIDGEVDFSNPELQPQTKINLIRVKIANKRKQFLPGMMAFVVIKTRSKETLSLSIDAVIQEGKKAFVWIQNQNGSFEARKVEVGMQSAKKIEIKTGLKAGDVVVTSGAYLIYSDYIFKKGTYPLRNDSIKRSNKHESMPGMNM